MGKIKDNVTGFSLGLAQRKLHIYAASGCYYMFMSLVPVTMVLCCILPYTPFTQGTVLNYVDMYFSAELATIMRAIVTAVYNSNASTFTISIFLTLFSASSSMKSLMSGMDAAYDFKKKHNFIINNILGLLYMILLVGALIVALVVMVYGGRILVLLRIRFHTVGVLDLLLSKARYVLVLFLLVFVFAGLYTLMTSEKVKFFRQLPGAVFSALMWVGFSSVFTLYVGISHKFGAYGIIGTIMVAMMWMFYCLLFLLIGGYINSFFSGDRHR